MLFEICLYLFPVLSIRALTGFGEGTWIGEEKKARRPNKNQLEY